jgi:cell division septation protein DedD
MNPACNSTPSEGPATGRQPAQPHHLTRRLDAALSELRAAAMEADPAIKGMWVSYDDTTMDGRFVLAGVAFDRSGKALAKAAELRAKAVQS